MVDSGSESQLKKKKKEDGSARSSSSRRNFLKIGAVGAAVIASAVNIPFVRGETSPDLEAKMASANSHISALEGRLTSADSQISTLQDRLSTARRAAEQAQSTSTSLQTQIDTTTAFITLGTSEQSILEAIVETFIPSDSSGPGAKEAGVIYFIDGQLAGKYGSCGNMYMQGPFVAPNLTGPVTVAGITYPKGTMPAGVDAGQRYQYDVILRDYWRAGLDAVQSYANSAYGGDFESLTAAQQMQLLQDLYNNKPTSFNNILPQDFFYELYFMTWAGFLTDPVYGGNKNMIGWQYVAFNGTNQGNFYGEGFTTQQLMVATTPTRLQPASLGQYQKGSP